MDIKDEQWLLIEGFIPKSINGTLRGRPPRNPREVLNGILWIMRTGAPWADLLPEYLDCLDSRIAAVVTTALERLPDFLLLCQGYFLLQSALVIIII